MREVQKDMGEARIAQLASSSATFFDEGENRS